MPVSVINALLAGTQLDVAGAQVEVQVQVTLKQLQTKEMTRLEGKKIYIIL